MAKSGQAAAGVSASMLGRAIEYQHEGKVELDWRKQGLICRLTLPSARVASLSALCPVTSRLDAGQGGGYLAPRSRSSLRQIKSLARRVMELLRSSR
jgi:hypothetical protein